SEASVTSALRPLLQGRDPSLALAVAALLSRADADGTASFGELAVAYREDHLDLRRQAVGEARSEGGVLSVDQVRRHLETSVLPRLVTDGLLEALPEMLDDNSAVRLRPEWWAGASARTGLERQELFALALEGIQAAETVGGPTAVRAGAAQLVADGLTKVYRRRRVVDDVRLDLRQGEIVGLLGPNGAGKTTTFYMIVGLIRPDAGRIYLDGQDISALPMYRRARRGIGYLAQEPSVFRRLTVEENVLAILETQSLTDAERASRLEELLDELSIKHLRSVPAYNLSGGERRRLEITRALVTSPKFMLLDEPFAGVDPIAVHDIQTIVAGLRRRGIGVLITDHNVEQTLDIVDRAYIVFEGRVQVAGTVRDLVFDDRVADLYLGPTLTARLRARLSAAA
ncbi:MAG TPA: LPS export ABC transporter ATP-binding protein, partial [Gemmatimonadales bacterium]|nr:LPS export ABC transporter ATP-binding protein [Gemmatimonadales bacterium]